ncbi:hypothetical protein B0H14DRAFT_3892410 [Mycena olivaceomarginata]|nr:hypothetical protein B0H14DRAFT_3892410 [Mycena olivaceomarginata]
MRIALPYALPSVVHRRLAVRTAVDDILSSRNTLIEACSPAHGSSSSEAAGGTGLFGLGLAQLVRMPQLSSKVVTQQALQERPTPQPSHVPVNDLSRGGPSSPIEHAFADQPEYQFTLRPVQNGTSDGPTIAKAIGLKRAEKVGGSRRKGKERADPKGKKRQCASSGSDNDSDEPVAKRGRPHGSANYGKDNVRKMFDLVAELPPVGQKGWKEVERRYNKWAKQNGRAERPPKALENKRTSTSRQKKPTGSASCPPEVKRVHEIEDLINQRVGTCELSDSEFDDRSENGSSDDDIEVVERTAIARQVQRDRDEARARRSFENTQILTLSQQLQRALERAELRNEMMGFSGGHRGRSPRRPRRSHPLGYRSHKRDSGLERVGGKIRCETKYPNGGGMTYWISDPSTNDYDDNDDENHNPWDTFDVPRRSRSRHVGSRRPISRRRTPSAGPSRRHISRCRTPTPGPSRFSALFPSPSPPPAHTSMPDPANTSGTRAPTSVVAGDAVELVVTPRCGPAVVLVVSPTKQHNTYTNN